jgi:hypothetical protein
MGKPATIEIPVISLWMPWAKWVMLAWKPIETRTHQRFACLRGKWIGIHATDKWDETAIDSARPYLQEWQIKMTESFRDIHGCLLGTIYCINYRPLTPADEHLALIECKSVQRYGLILSNPFSMEKPIPAKGKQGIWYYR